LVAGAIATVTLISFETPYRHQRVGGQQRHLRHRRDLFQCRHLHQVRAPSRRTAGGNVSVVIKSSETFDPTKIDPQTLRFGETGQEPSLVSCAQKKQDVNGDGVLDLTCSFEIDATGFQKGDTSGVLTGETFDNTHFSGSDSVQVR
jgi:hypothetical protein